MEYAEEYRSLKSKPSEVMKRTIETIKDWESRGLKIFSSVLERDVMEQAKKSDERFAAGQPLSILDGVPIAVKDMVHVNGHVVTHGTSVGLLIAQDDDIMIARLKSLGAIILGLTIMVEGGVSPFGYNSHFQGPHSAYSLNRYSGGSSSGSAVAVATGLVPVAIGFDGGGSIRIPCEFIIDYCYQRIILVFRYLIINHITTNTWVLFYSIHVGYSRYEHLLRQVSLQ